MEKSAVGQHGGGDLIGLDQNDGSNFYDVNPGGLSGVSSLEVEQSTPVSSITYPSGLMFPETVPSSASSKNSAYAMYGTGAQGIEQLSFHGGYSAPVTQGGYSAPVTQGGYSAPVTQGGYSAPVTQGGYSAPVAQGGYSAPVAQGGYSAPVAQGGYSAPVAQGGYSAPVAQGGYSAPVAQSHYTPEVQFDASAPTPATFNATSSPVLLDGSTLTPLPSGVPLPPRNTTPYLVEASTTSTMPSRDVQVGASLPGDQDLAWLTTDTVQGSVVSAYEQLMNPSVPGAGPDLVPERDVEERLARLQNTMEEKFGMQRKKFMNHMMQTDTELKRTRHALDKKDKELLIWKEQLKAYELEIDDIRTAAAANEIAVKESFEVEGRLLREEIASLKQVMKVTTEERDSFNQSTLQRERAGWANERQHLQQELHQLRQQRQQTQPYPHQSYFPLQGYNPPPPNVQPFAAQAPMVGQPYDQPQGSTHLQQQGAVPGDVPGAQPSQAPKLHSARALERHMQKAQAESDKLRAVVIPLEEEIASLKGKLQEAEETIRAFELSGSSSVGPLIDLTGDDEGAKSPVEGEGETEKQVGVDEEEVQPVITPQAGGPLGIGKAAGTAKSRKLKIQRELERERSLRSDVEIKLDVMTTQRNVLQEDLDRAQEEMVTLRSLLESEKQSKVDLRQTWEMANLQFIDLQQQYKVEVNQLRQRLETDESQRPQSASAQLTDTSGGEEHETEHRSDIMLSLPATQEHSGSLEGPDGATLSKSVDDMLLATGGTTEVEGGILSSKTAGLETLLSQLATVRNQLLEKQSAYEAIRDELRETKKNDDDLLRQKEKELDVLKADVAKYQMSYAQEQSNKKTLETKFLKLRDEIRMHVTSFRDSVSDTGRQIRESREDVLTVKKETQTEVVKLSQDRQRLWAKVEASREEYACLKQQHLFELEEQARTLTMAKVAQEEAETNVAATVEQLSMTQQEMEAQKEQLVQEVTRLRKQLLAEQEGSRANKLESDERVKIAQTEKEVLRQRCMQLEETFKAKEEAISVAEQIRDKSKNYLKQKDAEIEALKLEVESLRKKLKKLHPKEPVELLS